MTVIHHNVYASASASISFQFETDILIFVHTIGLCEVFAAFILKDQTEGDAVARF